MSRELIINKVEQLMTMGEIFCAEVICNDYKLRKSIWNELCIKHGFLDFVHK